MTTRERIYGLLNKYSNTQESGEDLNPDMICESTFLLHARLILKGFQ